MMQISRQQSRRDFLKTSASLAATGLVMQGCTRPVTSKRDIPIALQLYSVRTECAKDFGATIAAVAQMGYQGVEFAGYYDTSAAELRNILDDNGLKIAGTHTALDTVSPENLAATIEYNQIIGNQNLIIPWLNAADYATKDSWLKLADRFNELAEKLKIHNMRIGYHNHDFEFKPVDGEMPWDILAQATEKDVILQLDTANAIHGGADPLVYLKKYADRAVTIHIKEASHTKEKFYLGEGDVPWPEVVKTCQESGVTEWYIIEEEKDFCEPLECVKTTLANFKKYL